MSSTRQLNITLPSAMAARVKEKVASGAYASDSEVIREGLRALQARDRAIEAWLRDQVTPIHDAMLADPALGRTASEVRSILALEEDKAEHSPPA